VTRACGTETRRLTATRAFVGLIFVGLIFVGFALVGCGVPLQPTAQPIPSEVLPSSVAAPKPTASPSDAAADSTPVPSQDESAPTASRLRLWFVEDEGLTAVESNLSDATGADAVIQALAAGPTAEQAGEGLRTIAADPLTGQPLAALVPVDPSAMAYPADDSVITLQLSPQFTALPPPEQVLLLGQLVLSLTGAGAASIAFVDSSGLSLAVPLPDGRVLDTPARARDYGPLIYRP